MRPVQAAALLLAIHIGVLSSCGRVAPPDRMGDEPQSLPPAATGEKPFVHEVGRRGENLTLISKWYTGSAGNWKAVVRANPSIEPRRIRIGERIVIPAELLQRREPMPADYTIRAARQTEKMVPAPSEDNRSEGVDLFGPVDSTGSAAGQDDDTEAILENLEQ